MDKIAPGATNQSILFALTTAGLAIADMKLGYVRWNNGDGTSFTEVISSALTELATITTAHTDNFAKYLDADATGGNQFILRVDFPDAAFATAKDKVICNVYDDGNNVIAHRIFSLSTADLTITEIEQIRHRLNLDGTQTAPTAGGAAKMAGDDADLTLKSIVVENSAGNAVSYLSTGGNGHGMRLKGNGTGDGLRLEGGDVGGDGLLALGGAGGGDGISAVGESSQGVGIRAEGDKAGIHALLSDNTNGNGMLIEGGSGAGGGGSALKIEALGGNAVGMEVIGFGSEAGIKSTGGPTGIGFHVLGGATNGVAIRAESRNGHTHGVEFIGVNNGDGLNLSSDNGSGLNAISNGASPGIHVDSGSGPGMQITGGIDNDGLFIAGHGLGSGIHARGQSGGGTGHGMLLESAQGATGDGMRVESLATNGNGLNTIKTGTGIDLKASDHGDGSWEGAGSATLITTTIVNLVSQTEFDLADGSADNGAYEGCLVVITDAATSTQKTVGIVSTGYVGGTKTMKLFRVPGVFTFADGDEISILASKQLRLQQTLAGTIAGLVSATPLNANTLLVKELTNDALADLNILDLEQNRVVTFISGLCTGQSVGILSQAASGSDPITLTVTPMANFANIADDDEIIIT